jgi:hypothetical protein
MEKEQWKSRVEEVWELVRVLEKTSSVQFVSRDAAVLAIVRLQMEKENTKAITQKLDKICQKLNEIEKTIASSGQSLAETK